MVFVTLVKLVLVLYCRSFTNEIVKAYAQDHFFDVITNIIGLVAALLANYFSGWIDPVGAMIVSYISLMLFHLAIYNISILQILNWSIQNNGEILNNSQILFSNSASNTLFCFQLQANIIQNTLTSNNVSGFKQFSLCCSLRCIPFELGQ